MKIAGTEISHPDKILFPKKKITKVQVAEYYEAIAEKMLPYLRDRPLTLIRFPSGIMEKGFYQKNANDYFPDFIKRIEVETEEDSNIQVICNSKKSLIYLVNQNTISFHTWLSRKDKLRQPDKVIFDLDPPEKAFEQVKEGALRVRKFLLEKRIDSQIMTTGQNGLHIYYKIRRGKNFDEVKEQARDFAEQLVELHPQMFTTKVRKDQREGRIFVDYLRNAYAQTAVCPYSLRPNEDAGIATPIPWEALYGLKSADEINYSNYQDSLN